MFDGDDGGWTELVDLVKEYKLKPEAVCTADNVQELWHCHFVEEMIESLTRFQSEHFQIDAGNICDFDHLAIIRGLDHLTEVHNLFSVENKKRIRSYFREQIHCHLGRDCEALIHHCSRRRENDDGGQREDDHDILVSKIKEHGLPMDVFGWYLDLRKYGSVPHAGFGLGLERVVQFVTGMANIRDVIPFPRTPGSADF